MQERQLMIQRKRRKRQQQHAKTVLPIALGSVRRDSDSHHLPKLWSITSTDPRQSREASVKSADGCSAQKQRRNIVYDFPANQAPVALPRVGKKSARHPRQQPQFASHTRERNRRTKMQREMQKSLRVQRNFNANTLWTCIRGKRGVKKEPAS